MKKIRTGYLVNFLGDLAPYLTSVAFFAALLALSLSIKSDEETIQQIVRFIQSSSFALFIICMFTLGKYFQKSKATINVIFGLIVFLNTFGWIGYFWNKYQEIVIGTAGVIAVIAGMVHFGYFLEILRKIKDKELVLNKLKKWDYTYIISFPLIIAYNLYLFCKGTWTTENNLVGIYRVLNDTAILLAYGYIFTMILAVFSIITNVFEKIFKEVVVKPFNSMTKKRKKNNLKNNK